MGAQPTMATTYYGPYLLWGPNLLRGPQPIMADTNCHVVPCPRARHDHWEREMFYLTTHSTHFIYGYMASDIWLRTILIVRKETRCRHIGYSYRLTARVLLYAPSHRQDNTYHGLCNTSRGALAGTRNSSIGPPHEGSIRRPSAPWANALPLSYVPLPTIGCSIHVWQTQLINSHLFPFWRH